MSGVVRADRSVREGTEMTRVLSLQAVHVNKQYIKLYRDKPAVHVREGTDMTSVLSLQAMPRRKRRNSTRQAA
jgi:hypothetical protein